MEVVQNVAYEILGHSIYLEDGTEINNLLQENIVFTTREGFVDRTMHGDDVQDDTPASYWISNPQNRKFLAFAARVQCYHGVQSANLCTVVR